MRWAGLLCLAAVPVGLVMAASRDSYPPVNPDSGGPTGASLLGSTLAVVFLFLVLPRTLGRKRSGGKTWEWVVWGLFGLEVLCFLLLKRAVASHHDPGQWMGLGLLLIWVPVLPLYYWSYGWSRSEKTWLRATFCWMALLFGSGWVAFLPGVLEEVKFTSSLVAHSHLAMAGFTSAFVIFLMRAQRMGVALADSRFWSWNLAVLGYVAVMVVVGYQEAREPAWLMADGVGRAVLWSLRLLCGLVMLGVSWSWFQGVVREPVGERKEAVALS